MNEHPTGTVTVPRTTTPHCGTTPNSVHNGRVLPSPASEAWSDPTVVEQLVAWSQQVSPAAHALAHPAPVFGCPGCPDGGVPRDMSAETSWREVSA